MTQQINSKQLFKQAIDEARKIGDPEMRDEVFRHVAMHLARAGLREEAEELRAEIQTPVKDDFQCSELNYVIGLLNEGDFEKAVHVAQNISETEPVRVHAIALVAKTLHRAGQTERALQMLDDLVAGVKPNDACDDTLPTVVETFVELSLFKHVENLIDRMPRLDDRMRTSLQIANRTLLESGPTASLPYLDRALKYAKMFNDELGVETGSMGTVAVQYARHRFFGLAAKITDKIHDIPAKIEALIGLAVQIRDFDYE